MRFLLALTLATLPAVALAQGLPEPTKVQCYLPGPAGSLQNFLDMGLTQAFRIDASKMDPEVMAAFTGVWYGQETAMNEGVAINIAVYYSFEPNGLFQYQSKTCGPYQCSDNYGTGQWVGLRETGGQIRVIFNWSDLAIQSTCSGATGTLQGSVFQHNNGAVWQLVQKYEGNGMPVEPGMKPQ